ncbi:MAG: hypothetical protein BSOLF_2302 [Candidatus Carbobacillus altaicus]|uniref:Molybdopterin-guanine dinucleotide biosynthesis protein B (MobB) domain-containing protein n=1 Tax=Candidatus Carbonibacillus altaicus TaxID=2163959 RepID=A0A2R6Y308_9BACL|nr:MAG: hypothetical protein BSOLF_2302 [Candidatus Carbobacillus altaicus]
MRYMQFAGFSGSGKTTLIARVLAVLKNRGARTVVLKHHGHVDAPKPHLPLSVSSKNAVQSSAFSSPALLRPDALPDSFIFLEHGATTVLLVSGETCYTYRAGRVSDATQTRGDPARYPDCLKTLDVCRYDWLLIEGFKAIPWPKFVLVRDLTDLQVVEDWPNVKAVLFPDTLTLEEAARKMNGRRAKMLPFLLRDDLSRIIPTMMQTGGIYLDPTCLGHI